MIASSTTMQLGHKLSFIRGHFCTRGRQSKFDHSTKIQTFLAAFQESYFTVSFCEVVFGIRTTLKRHRSVYPGRRNYRLANILSAEQVISFIQFAWQKHCSNIGSDCIIKTLREILVQFIYLFFYLSLFLFPNQEFL